MKKLLLILKLSLVEMKAKPMIFLNVIVILMLGNLAPIIVSSLKTSTDGFLQMRSREILSADLSITGIHDFSKDQKSELSSKIDPQKVSSEVQFLTMARSKQGTMLAEVKAIDESYPLFGEITLLGQAGVAHSGELQKNKIAWLQQDLIEGLKIKVGDVIHLGHSDFVVQAQILKDSVLPQSSFSFAPRIFIGQNFVSETNLNQFGSQIYYRLYYALKESAQPEQIASMLKKSFDDPNIFVRTPHDAVEGFARFIDFFSRYLSIMTLVIYSIAWMSAFYIFQSLNQSHLKQSAIMMTLGGSRRIIGFIYLLQAFFLSVFSFAVAGLAGVFILKFLQLKLGSQLPEGFEFRIYQKDLIRIFAVSLFTGFCFVLTLMMKISRLNIQILLNESNQSSEKMPWRDLLILNSFILGLFVFLAYYLMGSQVFAISFVLLLLIGSMLSLYFGRSLFFLFKKAMANRPGVLRILSIHLSRVRFAQSLCFIAMALVAIVLNIVPHLMSSLKEDISPMSEHKLPSLFLFNIPEERLSDLEKFMAENKKELKFISPLIMARLTAINGEAPKQDYFLKYPVRISYRDTLIPSEKIVEGEPLPGKHVEGAPVYLSLAQDFSERWGVHVGDNLQFDVAGIPFSAKVRNLRSVRWSNFNPNFYFEFQTGVLDDAPKTWVANVQLGDSEKTTYFENQLVQKFQDISVIDIRKTIEAVSQIVGALVVPAAALSGLSAILCLLILGFVIWHHLLSRTEEIEIVKILGSEPAKVLRLFVGEYMLLALCAIMTGSIAGFGIAYYVCLKFLKIEVVFAWQEMLQSTFAFLVVMLVICYFLVSKLLGRSETPLVRS